MGAFRVAALTSLAVLLLSTSDAQAFRIIATSSGSAGIAGAPCCATDFDGGFDLSTTPGSAVAADGSRAFFIPWVALGEFAHLDYSAAAHASATGSGSRATVSITNWDSNFTGGSLEAFAMATVEQNLTPISAVDVYTRPVFMIDGRVSHAAGLTSTLTFNMVATLPGETSQSDNILFQIDGGTPGTTEVFSQTVIGPELFVAAGDQLFFSLRLSSQVSGVPNDIPGGDHFAEVDVFDTLSLVGFESFSDPGYSVPISVDYMSDGGEVFSTVPEPGTGLLVGLGLAGSVARLSLARRRRENI